MTPIFEGVVSGAKISLDRQHEFQNHLHSLEGKRVQLTVEKYRKKRSNEQNRWYWGVAVKLIAGYTGHEPEEVHEALKGAFCPKVLIGNLVAPKSTKNLDTVDFGDNMMEKVIRWAQEELNLTIPLPEDVKI